MLPSNFNRSKFSATRAASLISCAVWFHTDQGTGQWFHGWQDEVYQLTPTLRVFSHGRSLKRFKLMLDGFASQASPKYNPFVRAEIYENVFGNVILTRTMNSIEDATANYDFVIPNIITKELKIPGKHRLIDSFKSERQGIQLVNADFLKDFCNYQYAFWKANSRYAAGYIGKDKAA